jgi:NADH-quinone oxidoreductase subunit L
MSSLLWLVPALPAAGFLVLVFAGRRLSHRGVAVVGVGSVGLAALVTLLIALAFWNSPPAGDAYRQVLWTWFSVGSFHPQIALYLDALSLTFILIVTVVGFLIHLYSTEYMAEDESFARFFVYMNLFVASMLVLVLADDLLVLMLGWEGVGLCSYLLIGFWYKEPYNGYAARKAFIVTRVGDTAFIVGLFLLLADFGTLRIQPLMDDAAARWPGGGAVVTAAALLLLGGAVGKSAQLPLQTWLPDAMAGPTPVSALIHAATMVTAGVYLIARTHVLYELSPGVMTVVAVVGALTLLYAGFSALAQRDIKRVLAYSTVSQIGYMFLALGVAGWQAAVFHFITHAFFKALLFLAAGAVIEALGGEQDMFRMGGLRRRLPVAFWAMVVGAAALSALPIVTAGYYSKDLIVTLSLTSPDGGTVFWLAALGGAFLTSLYSFRLVFLVFYGEQRSPVQHMPHWPMNLPLVVLSALSVVGGLVWLPDWMGGFDPLARFLGTALPANPQGESFLSGTVEALVAPLVALLGIALAWQIWLRRAGPRPEAGRPAQGLDGFFLSGWGFDRFYDWIFVWPARAFAWGSRDDLVEPVVKGIARANLLGWRALSRTQSGLLRSYAGVIAVGVAVVLFVLLVW